MRKFKAVWAVSHCGTALYEQKLGGRTQMTSFVTEFPGNRIRLTLSNHYSPVGTSVSAVTVYNAARGTEPVAVTFNKNREIDVMPGESVISDAAELPASAGDRIEVRVFFKDDTRVLFGTGLTGSVHSPIGDFTNAIEFPAASDDIWVFAKRPFDVGEPAFLLSSVEIETDESAKCTAVLGDSNSFSGAWTGPLSRMMSTYGLGALLNLSISGNRLLSDTDNALPGQIFGFSAVRRYDWDITPLEGLNNLIIAVGGNDIYQPGTVSAPADVIPPLSAMKEGYAEICRKAHAKGIRVIGTTISPIAGSSSWNESKMKFYRSLNDWIKQRSIAEGVFDRIIDFEQILSDPITGCLKAEYDSGDHLHFNLNAGMALAEAVCRILAE